MSEGSGIVAMEDALRVALERDAGDFEEWLRGIEDMPVEGGKTLWEIEQEFRHHLIQSEMMNSGHSGEASWHLTDHYHKEAMSDLSSGGVSRIDEDAFYDAAFRAINWIEAGIRDGAFYRGTCSQGRIRHVIDETSDGLYYALSWLGLQIRYDSRGHRAQYYHEGRWWHLTEMDISRVRDRVKKLFCFARAPRKADAAFDAKPASWTSAEWQTTWQAFLVQRQVDAFGEWLESLPPWDGECRLDDWMLRCGMKFRDESGHSELVRWACRSILLVACRRTLEPGMKHDETPVLVGDQGVGKSKMLSELFDLRYRGLWFNDGLRLTAQKKSRVEALQGKVIVEISEMTGTSRGNTEDIKQFLTSQYDFERLAYRRDPGEMPRKVSMVGTANAREGVGILPLDASGNRRFVCIYIQSGNPKQATEWLDLHRGQLWAEAWHHAKHGESCSLPSELWDVRDQFNDLSEVKDEVPEGPITDWVYSRVKLYRRNPDAGVFTIQEVAEDIGYFREGESHVAMTRPEQMRIARVLQKLGCEKRRRRVVEAGMSRQSWRWSLPDDLVDEANRPPEASGTGSSDVSEGSGSRDEEEIPF